MNPEFGYRTESRIRRQTIAPIVPTAQLSRRPDYPHAKNPSMDFSGDETLPDGDARFS